MHGVEDDALAQSDGHTRDNGTVVDVADLFSPYSRLTPSALLFGSSGNRTVQAVSTKFGRDTLLWRKNTTETNGTGCCPIFFQFFWK